MLHLGNAPGTVKCYQARNRAILSPCMLAHDMADKWLTNHQVFCCCRKQIIDAAQASLARERVLSSAAAADAAAAVAALQGLDTAGTLSIFLTGRRAWLQGHLDACASITQPEEVSQALCELSHAVQLAVSQVGLLTVILQDVLFHHMKGVINMYS